MCVFGLGVQNEAGQRLTEFCQENALVIANISFQQCKKRSYMWTSPDWWNQIDYILCSWRWRSSAATKSLQSCPTRCDPIDGSPPGSPVPGILQARTLDWVAISFSSAWKWKVKVKSLSRVQLLVTPWTAAYQAPPSMGFFRQEYWSGVPLPSLGEALYSQQKQDQKLTVLRSWTSCYKIHT